MAIVGKYGSPDLFVTMTCNPKDPDILKCLKPGETALDRPDIVTRISDLQKRTVIDMITGRNSHEAIFGEVSAWVYVIEFQKRGLPHVHLLVTLKAEYKWRSAEIIDKFLSAEIPDLEEDASSHELVKSQLIHGPCGCINSKNPCMRYGKWRFNFPKKFPAKTTIDENGHVEYRRRNNGVTGDIKGCLDSSGACSYRSNSLLFVNSSKISLGKVKAGIFTPNSLSQFCGLFGTVKVSLRLLVLTDMCPTGSNHGLFVGTATDGMHKCQIYTQHQPIFKFDNEIFVSKVSIQWNGALLAVTVISDEDVKVFSDEEDFKIVDAKEIDDLDYPENST